MITIKTPLYLSSYRIHITITHRRSIEKGKWRLSFQYRNTHSILVAYLTVQLQAQLTISDIFRLKRRKGMHICWKPQEEEEPWHLAVNVLKVRLNLHMLLHGSFYVFYFQVLRLDFHKREWYVRVLGGVAVDLAHRT